MNYIAKFLTIPFGVDGISFSLVILTVFVVPIRILLSFSALNIKKRFLSFIFLFFLEFFIVLSISALDILSFYIYFEFTLVPMFLLIGFGGSRFRKIRASFFLFFYTLFGSVFMFMTLFYMLTTVGGTLFDEIFYFNFYFGEEKIL